MPDYTLPIGANQPHGLVATLQYLVGNVQNIPTYLLLFIFVVITGASYMSQERRTGRGILPMSLTIAGLITTTGAFILFLIDQLVNIYVVLGFVVATLLCGLWFFLDDLD